MNYLLAETNIIAIYKTTIAKKKSSYSCSSKHKLIMAHARKEGHKNY